MKVLTVFGTRPEAIKLAPVIRELQQRAADRDVQSVVCVTAQHRQMLDQVLELFELRPDYDLAVMQENQSLAGVAATVLTRLEPVLQQERPDWVLVQGDTTTVAAAALGAFYAGAQVGHVEAGLRTNDKWRPFPEEINRRVAGVIADRHFAPTERSCQNLLRENVPAAQIVLSGNPVIDALYWVAEQRPSAEASALLQRLGLGEESAAADGRRLILVTAHRRESFGAPLEEVCHALREIAERGAGQVQIVYAVHLNPNVQEPVYRILGDVPGVMLTPPLDYATLVHLLKRSHLALTDSGGIQEEAPGLGVPVLVLREVTERPEAVDAGTVRLVGTDRDTILRETYRLLDDPAAHRAMSQAVNPYGDGLASRRIVAAVLGESVEPFCPGSAASAAAAPMGAREPA